MNGSLANFMAFTWVPNPKRIGTIYPDKQYQYTRVTIDKMRRCCEFELYPEMTTAGNIHYHGLVNVYDKIKWYKSVLPILKMEGFVCIKVKVDEGWMKYITKDKEMMESLLKIELPIKQEGRKVIKQKKESLEDKRLRLALDGGELYKYFCD